MKSLRLASLLVGFCLVNYFVDIWLCCFNPYYSSQMALIVFSSPMFVVRTALLGVMNAYIWDWMIDLPLTIAFWTFVIYLVNKYKK